MSMSCQGMMFANNTNEIVPVNELHEDLICQSQTPHRTFSFQLSDSGMRCLFDSTLCEQGPK